MMSLANSLTLQMKQQPGQVENETHDPSKGAVAWPIGVELPPSRGRSVPGDGNWLWHVALASLTTPQGTLQKQGCSAEAVVDIASCWSVLIAA